MDLQEIVKEMIVKFTDDFTPFTSLDISNAVKLDGHSFRHREVAAAVRDLWNNGTHIHNQEYIKTNIMVRLQNGQSAMAYLYHHETVDPSEYVARSQSASVMPRPQDQDSPEPAQDSQEDSHDPRCINASSLAPRRDATPSLADVVLDGRSSRRRRSLSDVVSGARKSIFDIAKQVKSDVEVLVSRHGPRVVEEDQEEAPENTTEPAPVQDSTLDRTSRRQKADCRLEIPPTWVSSLGWESGDKVAAIRNNISLTLKPAGDVSDDENVCGLMTVTTDGRLRLTKTALDNSGVGHGPNQELNLVLLDNAIVVG